MAEDDSLSSNAGLNDADIRTNIYEGGCKSWECSIDLAKLLLDRGPRKDIDDLCRVDHVVELGCGTAIPSLILFQYAIESGLSLYFTLADYNAAVLRLVTLPNLLLTWAKTSSSGIRDPLVSSSEGDLEITPGLVTSFKSFLAESGITLSLISGAWSPPLVDLIPTAPSMTLLVLASETIYSPASLSAFTETLVGVLQRVKMGKAMMGAKRMYFGVGGSVDTFKEECARRNAVAYEIDNHGVEGLDGHGVRRCLLEVQMM
ncbi:hypothetical protein EV356DRAFT_157733 [Viridothelium virens]|uniref:protein-histidine N-methyltransferase n=1 Tax=Viridothelium virens TaxID=1048519 RepID=A0A6A6H8E9_VIRVR|nr:hypothetical protein EV356DRAFT_157733 [Viridothelium virens]